MSLSKRAVVLGLLIVSQACYLDFRGPGRPRVVAYPVGSSKTTGEKSLANGFGSKIVEDKKPPTRLVARDGTSCVVSDKKYHSTNLGASVWCTWFDTNR